MKRAMLQLYTNDSLGAVNAYIEAFNGKIISSYKNDSGSYYHCEIMIDEYLVAISEVDNAEEILQNNMQLCFQYNQDELHLIEKAYNVLCEGATIHFPLGSTDYAKQMVDFTDQFGIRWCLFG